MSEKPSADRDGAHEESPSSGATSRHEMPGETRLVPLAEIALDDAGEGRFRTDTVKSPAELTRHAPFETRSEGDWKSLAGMARRAARHWIPAAELDDVVQDTLIELLAVECTVHDEAAFVAAVARNRARRQHRLLRRRPLPLLDDVLVESPAASHVSSGTIRDWLTEVALPCLRGAGASGNARASVGTPLELRVVVALATGSSGFKAIARDLGSSVFSVRRAARAAANRIRCRDVPPPLHLSVNHPWVVVRHWHPRAGHGRRPLKMRGARVVPISLLLLSALVPTAVLDAQAAGGLVPQALPAGLPGGGKDTSGGSLAGIGGPALSDAANVEPVPDAIREFRALWPALAAAIVESSFSVESMSQELDWGAPDPARFNALAEAIDGVLAGRRAPALYDELVRGLLRPANVREEQIDDVIHFRGLPSYRTHARFRHRCDRGEVHLEWSRLNMIDRGGADETIVLTTPEFVLQSDPQQRCVHVLGPNQWRTRKDPRAFLSPLPLGRGSGRIPDGRRCGAGMAFSWPDILVAASEDGLPACWAIGDFEDLGEVARTGTAFVEEILPRAGVFVLADYGERRNLPYPEVLLQVRCNRRGEPSVNVGTVEVMRFHDVGEVSEEARFAIPPDWAVFDHTVMHAKHVPATALGSSPHRWARHLALATKGAGPALLGDRVGPAYAPMSEATLPATRADGLGWTAWVASMALVGVLAVIILRRRAAATVAALFACGLSCSCAGDIEQPLALVHEVGRVTPTSEFLEHEFTFVPAHSVVATEVVTSCGCITTASAPIRLQAGVAARIPVRMGIAQSEGPVEQSIELRADRQLLARLTVRAHIVRDYAISPPRLHVGPMLPGATDRRILTFSGTTLERVDVEAPDPIDHISVEPVGDSAAPRRQFAFDVSIVAPERACTIKGTVAFRVWLQGGRSEVRGIPLRLEVQPAITIQDRIVTWRDGTAVEAVFRIRDASSTAESYRVDTPAGVEALAARFSPEAIHVVARCVEPSRSGVHRIVIRNDAAGFIDQVLLNVVPN